MVVICGASLKPKIQSRDMTLNAKNIIIMVKNRLDHHYPYILKFSDIGLMFTVCWSRHDLRSRNDKCAKNGNDMLGLIVSQFRIFLIYFMGSAEIKDFKNQLE